MTLEKAELTLNADDIEAGTNEGVVLEIQSKTTRYGEKYIARLKMNDGRKWAVWLSDSDVRTLARYTRDNSKDEEGLKIKFGTRSYEKKDGTEGGCPEILEVE